MKILKNRIFLVLATAIIVGSITAYATISPNSESIIYDNTNSGITSTNMQDAIDELYNKAEAASAGNPELPIDSIIGHTIRATSSNYSYTGSTYRRYLTVYYDGAVVYNTYIDNLGASTSYTIKSDHSDSNPMQYKGEYKIIVNFSGSYSQETFYTHGISITVNGYSLKNTGQKDANSSADTGTITIE